MATPPDPIAIARDIAQESCLRIPMTEPERISQRHFVFAAASAVKDMCDDPKKEEDVVKLILYGALIVEYAADFLADNPLKRIPEPTSTSVLNEMELIKDILKSIQPEDNFETETLKDTLIDALAFDLGVDQGLVSQSIVSSFKQYREGPQEAKKFIEQNSNWYHKKTSDVEDLSQFLRKSSVSLLALRDDDAVKFLDILEKAARSDSVAKSDEKQRYQTYLRRLSHRSKQHPGAFHLSKVENSPQEPTGKSCDHSKGGPQKPTAGGFGKVCRAKWNKLNETVVVATKTLLDQGRNSKMLFHEAAFWYYLDRKYVVPFYGVSVVDGSQCLVSLWMNGGRICCYVDGKTDSIRLDLLHQVAHGIEYLHTLNFVHCDIKPENILIEDQKPLKALITDFGFSNASRRTHVAYSKSYGHTDGYVSSGNATPWDPSNDVYAFGVTCCQVALVDKRTQIGSVPDDIATCISQLPTVYEDPKDSKETRQQFIQKLHKKFFPLKRTPPSPFFEGIFGLVAKTCYIRSCKIDDVVNLLDEAAAAALAHSVDSLSVRS